MVGYQKFVSIFFEVARQKGARIDSLETSQEILTVAAQHWSEHPELKTASVSFVRDHLQSEVQVS
jgi:hypothetical protein